MFVKAPRAGEVKTRLAQVIGPQAACSAYQQLVEIVLEKLGDLPRVQLRFAPDNALDEIKGWQQPGWTLKQQGKGDLGQRMQRAFEQSFAAGAKRVVIIGSDCPAVELSDVQQAWQALTSHEVVLGPAIDGGYWLIGLREVHSRLFEGIQWSAATVFRETVERAQSLRLKLKILRALADIDTAEDWQDFSRSRNDSVKPTNGHL